MTYSRAHIQILIVDDEASQGKALLEAFTRAGYQATWVQASVQALTYAQRTEYQVLFIDCMLPKMNGVDLAEEIVKFHQHRPKIFLYSGIFKDKAFIKDAVTRTQCEAFLHKPLQLADVLNAVEEALQGEQVHDLDPITMLYSSENLNDDSLERALKSQATMPAFHVPMLVKRLLKSNLTGDLTLISSQGDLNVISFCGGQLFQVRTPDKDSYFGGLAVGFGFVSPDEVIEALRDPTRKLLGQKLIDSLSLSPHAILVILEEQLALRLSQTLRDEVMSLQWTPQRYPTPEYALNPNRYDRLLEDWIQSKFTISFMRDTLQSWSARKITGNYHPQIHEIETVGQLLQHSLFEDERDIPALFAQLLLRNAFVGASIETATVNFKHLESRIDGLLKTMNKQNHFEVLGLSERAHGSEVNRAYDGLKVQFDPANLPTGSPTSLINKCAQVFKRIQEAHSTLTNDIERARYANQLQTRRSTQILEAEPLFRAAILELTSGHAKSAAAKLQNLIDRKLEFKDLKAYRIWAGLKLDRKYKDITLEQIPPEERQSAAYMMAKGLSYRYRGHLRKALQCYQTAQVLDPRSNIAAHELKKLALHIQKHKSSHRDLFKEVTMIFDTIVGKSTKRGA